MKQMIYIYIFFTNEVDKGKVIMNFTISLENIYQKIFKGNI